MSAVYAFARRIDDIGDGDGEAADKLSRLEAERGTLAAIAGSRPAGSDDPVQVALGHARERFDLPLEALGQLIDAVELDVRETSYETFDELVVYCRGVAGSIGRLCLAIFSGGHGNGHAALADDLGVAMQLTNILRDIREDLARGRIYLPAEDLRRFGAEDPTALPHAEASALIRFEAERAEQWFDSGLRLVEQLDARSSACVLAMTGIYRSILERIEREPAAVLRERISLGPLEKTWVAARSLMGARAA